MSKNRFKVLLSHITFDDFTDQKKNWSTDCFVAMRPVWGLFNYNLTKCIAPSKFLTIDETLYPIKHQITFKQYNPNKPHTNDLLWKSLNNDPFCYTYKAVPYAAKTSARDSPYYINATVYYIKYLITETKRQVNLKEQNVSADCLYTSIEAANLLLEQNMIIVATVHKNRVRIPPKTFDPKAFSKSYHFKKEKKDLCLTSYIVQSKFKGKKM